KRTLTSDQIEFVGYGVNAPLAKHNDYEGRNVKGKVVVFLGSTPPKGLEGTQYRRALFGRARYATEQEGAIASIGVGGNFGRGGAGQPQGPRAQGQTPGQPAGEGAPAGAGAFGGGQSDGSDFTTVQRLDAMFPPAVTGQDEFFEFLFSGADVKYAELKEKASKGEPLRAVTLKKVRITFNIDAKYQAVRTQYTQNVVGIIEGTDQKLKDTYVASGAHYDHVGYAEGEPGQNATAARGLRPPGRVTVGATNDRIWNGADDDGSGTVTIMGIAKAFATGAKPKRSLVFVWHSGEERGLW